MENRSRFGNKFVNIGLLVMFVVFAIFGIPIIDLRSDDTVVTLVKFEQIQNGMTIEQIIEIVGEEGTVLSDESLEEELGGEIKTIVVEWKNGDFSGMKVIFKDGKLVDKSQTELE